MPLPNIVFLFSDQQRWDTMGCYGQPLNTTPNLDRIASEGALFTSAFTCQPVCGPARASLQTGLYATETGCFTNHRMLGLNQRTIAHHLAGAGYDTAYIGKWHLASQGPRGGPDDFTVSAIPPERRGGYRHWMASDVLEFTSHGYDGHVFNQNMQQVDFPAGRYRVDSLTDFAIEYLQSRTDEQPFFLFVSYIEPHHQNDMHRFEGPKGSAERFADFVVPGDLEGTEGDWKESYPDYLGCVNSLDENAGRIARELDRLGMADNTLLVYTSDHGSHFRTRNAEYKRSCHEASIHIPLIIRGPGFTGGRPVDGIASLIDLPPTLLAAAGIEPPPEMRGRPLQELVSGQARDWPGEAFIQISESEVARAIRTPRWKYCVHAPDARGSADPGSDTYVEQFLYDLASDPHERTNLARDTSLASVRGELAKTLKRRMAEAGEAEPRIVPAS